jgi:hypothetical protein
MSKKTKKSDGRCRRVGRIAKQRQAGTVYCYKGEASRRVLVRVCGDGFNYCTREACPFSERPIPQDWD